MSLKLSHFNQVFSSNYFNLCEASTKFFVLLKSAIHWLRKKFKTIFKIKKCHMLFVGGDIFSSLSMHDIASSIQFLCRIFSSLAQHSVISERSCNVLCFVVSTHTENGMIDVAMMLEKEKYITVMRFISEILIFLKKNNLKKFITVCSALARLFLLLV